MDNQSPPPTSPDSSNGKRTQYAEVVLQSPVNGTDEDEEPPSLPQKSYKNENESEKKMEQENESSIWVKNSSDNPELPAKASTVATVKNTTTDNEIAIEPEENEMKDENENGMKNEMKEDGLENEEDLLLTHNASSKLEKAIQNLDASRPKTPEKPRKNYEDMTLDSPDRESLPERRVQKDAQFSPKKLDFTERGSPTTERRQILDYENVELHKPRPKDAVVTTMLITDIDQETDPDYVVVKKGVSPDPHDIAPIKKHSYENVTQGMNSTEGTEKEGSSQNYEEMSGVESKNYEDMEGVGVMKKKLSKDLETTPGYVVMQSEKRAESYENIDIIPQGIFY